MAGPISVFPGTFLFKLVMLWSGEGSKLCKLDSSLSSCMEFSSTAGNKRGKWRTEIKTEREREQAFPEPLDPITSPLGPT